MNSTAASNVRMGFLKLVPRSVFKVLAVLLSFAMVAPSLLFGPGVKLVSAATPASLKTVPIPEPANLGDFVKNKLAAQVLGKALFWDAQLGSDGQACASCHFQAGADSRARNQVSPGLNAGDTTFQVRGPNQTVVAADFPFHQIASPANGREGDPVVRDSNDVLSSQGVFKATFAGIDPNPANSRDLFVRNDDAVFNVGGTANTRRVEPRNTPTTINAVFTFSNFWDGRARNIFNGRNPIGELDNATGPEHQIFVNNGPVGAAPTLEFVTIPDASLASQAVGPPLSEMEMSYIGRTWFDLGKKMIARKPLQFQTVHTDDSLLGLFADTTPGNKGLTVSYASLIRAAFEDKFWNGADVVINVRGVDTTFTQMEANFSLFFGLAVQLYEATLVSDDSKFDRVQEGRATFTDAEKAGESTFFGAGHCGECHSGPQFTEHSTSQFIPVVTPAAGAFGPGAVEFMRMDFGKAFYDKGMYNIGVRPTGEDLIRGDGPPNFPFPLAFSDLAILKAQNLLPADVAVLVPDLPIPAGNLARFLVPPLNRTAVDGAAKVATIRNVELTGPYFHAGQQSTLQQVVEFYLRKGNFPVVNEFDLDKAIKEIGKLRGKLDKQGELVAFMLTLTDDRVRDESAPFDHPELLIPSGDGLQNQATGAITETYITWPAVGANGRTAQGLPTLGTFLGLSPFAQQ